MATRSTYTRDFLSVAACVLLIACGDPDSEDGDGTSADDTSEGSGDSDDGDSGNPDGSGDSGTPDTDGTADTGDSGDTAADTTDTGDSGDSGDTGPGEEPPTVDGCDGATLYENPADPSVRGPWPVGAKTVNVDGLTVEVWYPAEFGSDVAGNDKVYDVREQLPASQQSLISDDVNPWQDCDCQEDLPLDAAHGPYPVVVFVHGTAGFRTQSLTHAVHWASRGFVVAAADYPGLKMADNLALLCPDSASGSQNLSGDTDKVLAGVLGATGDLSFLAGATDNTRTAVIGHSAGGNAASGSTDKTGVRVVVPLAASGTTPASSTLESVLYLGGTADSVVAYNQTVSGYEGSASPRRLVGIDNAGHLAFSDICSLKNDAGQNLIEIATEAGVCGVQFAGFLFDCDPSYIPDEQSWDIVHYASSAVLEEVMHCRPGPNLADIGSVLPGVSEYQEAL